MDAGIPRRAWREGAAEYPSAGWSRDVTMNEKYIQALRDAIRHMHGCVSRYIETVPVKEDFKGQAAWEGDVEIFDLNDRARIVAKISGSSSK